MFQIERKSKLKMNPPKFACDTCLSKQIEPPLPSKHFFMAIAGSAGSGKTSMMVNLITSKQAYKRVYHAVHVIMPSHSVASLKSNVFRKHDKVYDELDYETLDGILEQVMEDAEDGYQSLLVMDDVTASLKDKEVQKLMKNAIFLRRHYHLSIVVLVQSYNSMPLPIRKTISHLVMFKPRNKREYSSIFDELIFLDKETSHALVRYVFDRPYRFLYVDVENNAFHKDYDRILIKDAEEGSHQIEEQGEKNAKASKKGHK